MLAQVLLHGQQNTKGNFLMDLPGKRAKNVPGSDSGYGEVRAVPHSLGFDQEVSKCRSCKLVLQKPVYNNQLNS